MKRGDHRPRSTAARAVVVVLCVVATLAAVAGDDGVERYRGRPLGDVLRDLRDAGLALVYSSAVVDPDVVVPVEPRGDDPIEILSEVLAAVGLRPEPGPGRSILILAETGAGVRDGEDRAGAAPLDVLGFRETVRVVPGERTVDAGRAGVARSVEREDVLLVPAIGGDVGRVVDKLPGVVAADNSAAWSIRGSLPGDTSLVVDGLELYDPYHLREFQSPFTLLDPRVVDRIDVLPGAFTVEYGDRHGAFVEIETENQAEHASGEIEVGTLNSRALVRAPLADGTGAWLVAARGWYPEAVVDSLGLGGGERLRPRMGDLFAKWTRARPSGTIASIHGLLSYDRIAFQESGEDDNERVDAISRHGNVWARAVRMIGPGLRSETVVSAGEIRRVRNGVASPEDDVFVVRDRRELTYLGATQELVRSGRPSSRLKLGVSARYLDASYRYELRGLGAPDPDRSAALDPGGWQFGAYAACRRRLLPSVAMELGLRWDRQEIADDDRVAPRVHLLWTPSDRTEMRVAVGRFVQSQRVHELSIADGETTFSRAEVSDQIDWMIRRRGARGTSVRIDLYRRDLDRLRTRYENLFSIVELFPEAADDRVAIAPRSARLQGLELTVQGARTRGLRWWAAYGLASAEDRVDGRDVPRILDQRHTGKFLVAWTGRSPWTVALSGVAHTGRPYTTVVAREVARPGGGTEIEDEPGPRNAERLPGYLRLDLKVSRRVPSRSGTWTFTVDVLNLTDRTNACCVADFFFRPTGGGEVAVDTTFDPWLEIVPTFSVRWQSGSREGSAVPRPSHE